MGDLTNAYKYIRLGFHMRDQQNERFIFRK